MGTDADQLALEIPEPEVPSPAAEVPPSLEAQLAAAHEARIRAEAEAATLRSMAPPAKAEPTTPPQVTEETIEAAFQAGRIDEATRQNLLLDLRLDKKLTDKLTQRDQTQQLTKALKTAERDLSGYVARFPDLANKASALIGKVQTEINTLVEKYALDPDDPRTHLRAVEKVCGAMPDSGAIPIRQNPPPRSFATGGAFHTPQNPPPEKSRGEQLFDSLVSDAQEFMIRMRGSREKAIKTLEHTTEEQIGKMRRQGRFATR